MGRGPGRADPSRIIGAHAIRNMSRRTRVAIRVEQALGEALPFRAGVFDLDYGRQLLHHMSDPEAFCREVPASSGPAGSSSSPVSTS